MKHIKALKKWKIAYLALLTAVALTLAVSADFQVFSLNAGNEEVIIADNTNATPVESKGTAIMTSAENEAASMKTANTTAPYIITTGLSGDAIGGNVIACKNVGGAIILAISETMTYDTKTTLDPILC